MVVRRIFSLLYAVIFSYVIHDDILINHLKKTEAKSVALLCVLVLWMLLCIESHLANMEQAINKDKKNSD